MTDRFTFCGFDTRTEALIFERTLACDAAKLKAALDPNEIADDPDIAHVYPIAIESVRVFTGEDVPAGDYFVNGVQ